MGIAARTGLAALAAASVYAGVSGAMAVGLTRSKRIDIDDTPGSVGLPFEEIAFEARGGGPSLSGWLIPAPGTTVSESVASAPWVVMVHGFGTNRADPTAGLIGLARDLNSCGNAIFMFDLRACGRSGGDSGSVGYYERLDLLGALDLLGQRGVTPRRTALVGFSLGGAVCLLVGSVPGTCAVIVTDSCFADLRIAIDRSARGLLKPLAAFHLGMRLAARRLFGINIDELSPARALAASEVPCLVIHGELDRHVPGADANLLERALSADPAGMASGSRQVWRVSGAGHVQAYRTARGEYVEKVASFISAHLATSSGD